MILFRKIHVNFLSGIPYALHQAGFGLGIGLLILVAALTDYSLILMVRSGHICGEMSYQGLMRASFGRAGFYILTALQFVYPFIGMYIIETNIRSLLVV